jgi:hypothetical protein
VVLAVADVAAEVAVGFLMQELCRSRLLSSWSRLPIGSRSRKAQWSVKFEYF